jgi:signal transduction histidine kinase
MLSGIAHEVRNPLAGMELFTGILRDELPEGDERRAHVDRIGRELGYLSRVVSEFLDYARRPAPELGEVDLAAVAADVAELMQAEAERAGVGLAVEAGAPVPCRADAVQLRRAALNLARNAVQAAAGCDPPGAVRLRAWRDGGDALLEVWNTGPPIPAEIRDRIFEPFFTTREKGTGLGLAFVREIVTDHGGSLEVESDADGTRFRVRLSAGA